MGQSYVATCTNATPYLDVYPFSSSGYGTRFSNPATLPTGGAIVAGIRFSPSGDALVLAHTTTPRLDGYPFSASGFGTRFSDPATLPGTIGTGTSFISSTEVAVSTVGTPSSMTYDFSSSSGWGTRRIGSPTSISGGTAVHARSNAIFFSYQNTPWLAMYPPANPGLGTRYANPSPVPTSTPSSGYGAHVDSSATDVALSQSATPFFQVWPWTVASGFGTRYTITAPSGFTSNYSVKFSENGSYLALGSTQDNLAIYPWTTGSGQGTRWSAAASPPQGNLNASKFLGSDFFVVGSSPYLFGYPYTSSGLGTRYANPVGNTASAGTGIDAVFVPANVSMIASAGTFTFTGVAATLTKSTATGRTLTASAGSFSLTGNTTGLAVGRKVTASQGTFSLTGIAAGLKATRVVTATAQSYSLTGIANRLASTRTIIVSAATFTLTSYPANLVATTAKTLFAATGHFNLIGQASNLKSTRTIACSTSSFTVVGKNTGTAVQYKIISFFGSFSLTGINSRIIATRQVTCVSAQFTATGINNRLFLNRKIIATSNAFALTAYGANLVKTIARKIFADTGYFTLTGISLILSKGSKALASVGIFTVGTSPARLASTRIIISGPGTFSLSGQPSTLAFNRKLPISSRQFVVSGIASDLFRTRSLYATPRQFLLTGNTAYLKIIHPPIICQAGTFTLPVLAAATRYSNSKVSQFPPRLEFNSTGKNVNLKPSRAIIGTMSFAMEQTACALRWHRI